MLKEHQPAMGIDEQIHNLKSIGLIFENEEEAKAILNHISYFRLIKAYSIGLKDESSLYHNGITFGNLCELYNFDREFRSILFTIIEQIEITLRCRLANYFCIQYGVLGYEDPHNVSSPIYHQKFIEEVNRDIRYNSNSPFVKNFKNNYKDGKIPFYAIVEILSFGTLSKFYKNLKNKDKKQIAKLYNIPYTYLESWFESISYVRNVCAHYGRLYNAILSKTPMLFNEDKNIGNHRIFSVLICLKYLYPSFNWNVFVEILQELIKKYPFVNVNYMGFPTQWEKYLQ